MGAAESAPGGGDDQHPGDQPRGVRLLRRSLRAIFAETTQSTQLADTLAQAVEGDVEVVELFTESLGEDGSGAETYLDMMRTNAGLVADALS
ncbi:MAG: metal ABC transporter solute-binding protein, Zn/Mn family [Acidimicrobiales bacterium]